MTFVRKTLIESLKVLLSELSHYIKYKATVILLNSWRSLYWTHAVYLRPKQIDSKCFFFTWSQHAFANNFTSIMYEWKKISSTVKTARFYPLGMNWMVQSGCFIPEWSQNLKILAISNIASTYFWGGFLIKHTDWRSSSPSRASQHVPLATLVFQIYHYCNMQNISLSQNCCTLSIWHTCMCWRSFSELCQVKRILALLCTLRQNGNTSMTF